MKELYDWDKDSLTTAKRLLDAALKDCYGTNTTMFDQLLHGLIDTKAASAKEDHVPALYGQVIEFCADRLFKLTKQRKTVKALKDIAAQYSARSSNYLKEHINNRVNDHLSVGEHQFNSLKDEPVTSPYQQSSEQLKAIEDAFTYYSSDNLRAKQRKLSSYANGIQKELLNDKLKSVLPKHEQDTITEAVSIIRNLKQTFEHAKERKARDEKRREREDKERKASVRKALNEVFNTELISKVNTLNFALFIADNKYKDGYDRNSILSDARKYVDNSQGWYFSEVSSYIKTYAPRLIEKVCFKTTDFINYEQVQKPSDAVATLHLEWQSKQESITKQHSKLFSDLKTKLQIEEIKTDLSKNQT